MKLLLKGQLGAFALLLLGFLLDSVCGQVTGEECFNQFKKGREDFVLDVDESVKDGATYISSPKLERYRDCISACCKEPKCNVAVMEKGEEEGSVSSCFLFDCLYKKKYACRFVKKQGYMSYFLDSVYEGYLQVDGPSDVSDRPPTANGGQDLVVQPGEIVTLNGITSSDDQQVVSYLWNMLTVYPYAVIEKTNFDDQIIVYNLTSGMYKFQLTVTDNSGQSDSTKVTVLVLTPEQSEHHCMAPKKIGPCRGSFPRWHYNAASETCEQFMFGGCRENLNNYLTNDECTNACAGSGIYWRCPLCLCAAGEKCGAPCTTEQFTCGNGCCLDPGLECDSTPQCSDKSDEQECDKLDNNFRILMQIPLDEQKVRCTELPDSGPCRDSFTKWYYDPFQKMCFRFNYGGCSGNDNRFDSPEACIKVCRGVTEKDVFVRHENAEASKEEEQHTIFLAIAAILGLAVLILVGVLLYCFMKGRKKSSQHQRVLVNPPPVSFEDRERLVYNSTTKPI
uniref:Serine peptidase inhibitor, Kunitz type 1 a n=1 Tax=Sparus aurata TaxID=8175 RepID=A0A671XD05_SPAAU